MKGTDKAMVARFDPVERLRLRLVHAVRKALSEAEPGRGRGTPSDDALFERDSPIRLVHADVLSMMVGGIRSLLLQMLHPHALQGVLDHSDFRRDMQGRLRRTAQFIAVTSFGSRQDALAAIGRVNAIHDKVKGTLADGTPYTARDPRVLAWVHLAGATSFLTAYLTLANRDLPGHTQDEYYRQFALVARALGADPVPENRREAELLMGELRQDLRPSPEAREVARLVLHQRPAGAPPGLQRVLGTEAIALMPRREREMLALPDPGMSALAARAASLGMGRTLRWAFRQ